MLGRTDDFLSEKVKEHGIARFGKRKEPVIGLITGFFGVMLYHCRFLNPRLKNVMCKLEFFVLF
jgi:hypothetical protein